MKIKKNKLLIKNFIYICIIVAMFNFIAPTIVKADTEDDKEKVGGALFSPIQEFLSSVGDAVIWIMQYAFLGDNGLVVQKLEKGNSALMVPTWVKNTDADAILVSRDVYEHSINKIRIEIPQIRISPESIFSNRILAFDINFFSPSNSNENSDENINNASIQGEEITNFTYGQFLDAIEDKKVNENEYIDFLYDLFLKYRAGVEKDENGNYVFSTYTTPIDDTPIDEVVETATATFNYYRNEGSLVGEVRRGMLDSNTGILGEIINIKAIEKNEVKEAKESSAQMLRPVVSFWYNLLRNISIIGLLSVLVYIGIKIITSTIAAEKSKYIEMLKDWLIALFLLFFMHYFMSFVVTVTSSISTAIISGNNQVIQETSLNDSSKFNYFGDQLIGEARIQLQSKNFSQMFAYTVIYVVLIIYTVIFAVIYLKRVIYMAFFTMIAPLVALTYPLDKIRDKKAQAFDYWMKEYVFNALIQPMHLILYYLLVGSSLELAKTNPIYALVAIGFLIPAEKIVRKFFGFDKSTTAGVLGGALSGALAMQGINALKKAIKGAAISAASSGKEKDASQVRTADSGKNTGSLMSDISGGSGEEKHNIGEEQDGEDNSELGGERQNPFQNDGNQEENANLERENLGRTEQEENDQQDRKIKAEQEEKEANAQEQKSENKAKEENKKLKAGLKIGLKLAGKGAKFGGKTLLRAYGAAALGTVGIAAGLASEKYSNAFTWGLGGAVAGKMLADSGMNFVGSTLPSTAYRIKHGYEEIRDDVEKGIYTSKERKIIANERADEAFRRSQETRSQYRYAFGNDDYKKAIEAAMRYREYGITDNETIIKAMKLDTQGLDGLDDRKRILAAKLATQAKNEKDIEQMGERLAKNGFTQQQVEIMKQAMRRFNDWA